MSEEGHFSPLWRALESVCFLTKADSPNDRAKSPGSAKAGRLGFAFLSLNSCNGRTNLLYQRAIEQDTDFRVATPANCRFHTFTD